MKEFIHYEESDFFSTKKDSRQERRRVSKRDRSKFKKTDSDKQKKDEVPTSSDHRHGIITSIRGQEMYVDVGGVLHVASLRGLFKKDKKRMKNLAVVG
ncbi:MAG TPA: hypothetical protein VN457_00170, partial [Chlamydiales bacterium]|nr:hypothetical protein [Chlamydiales bacterium]